MQGHFKEAQKCITELKEQQQGRPGDSHPTTTTPLQEEIQPLNASLAKTQKAEDITEAEIGRLRGELRQSFDRETSMTAQARKALKEMQDKLQKEGAAHQRTSEAHTQRIDMEAHVEQKILEMREEGFEGQLDRRNKLAKVAEQRLKDEIEKCDVRNLYEKPNTDRKKQV